MESKQMIKRMVIMLVAVAVVFGGIFGFQVFKAAMIKKFITALSNPPQTVSVTRRRPANGNEDRSDRLVARGQGRRSVARGLRRRRIDLV